MKRVLIYLAVGILALTACGRKGSQGWWEMRGVVLTVDDLATVDWPKLASECGINTIGTHINPGQVRDFLATDKGKQFLAGCKEYGITVEHQLHAVNELLPRELFDQDPSMFRMNEDGERTPDFNCCVHSEKALSMIAENAASFARVLRADNHRYYYWLDDGAPVCMCPSCKDLSASDQALIIENRMLEAIREVDPEAMVAHLAYYRTLEAPAKVKPDQGIFLEFAPIFRSWERPLCDTAAVAHPDFPPMTNGENLRYLEDNLKVFPASTAVVLEYWLDVSLFSRWKKPAVELPWNGDVFRQDISTYASYGIRNVTSFAVYMDDAYFARFPSTAALKEYGTALAEYK